MRRPSEAGLGQYSGEIKTQKQSVGRSDNMYRSLEQASTKMNKEESEEDRERSLHERFVAAAVDRNQSRLEEGIAPYHDIFPKDHPKHPLSEPDKELDKAA